MISGASSSSSSRRLAKFGVLKESEPMQTLTVDTARLRTHCWVAGPEDGEPLLMVHGNLVTGRFFQALAERMPNRFRMVAPDLRSFGRTAAVLVHASRGLLDWTDDVRSVAEAPGC